MLLSDEAKDDSPPLSSADAIRIGTEYFKKRFPNMEVVFGETSAEYKGFFATLRVPFWSLFFWKIEPSDPRFVQQVVEIIVKDNGVVDDAKSGVIKTFTMKPLKENLKK